MTGCDSRRLPDRVFPENPEVDERTAVLLYFHDHDWEPPLLLGTLDTPAFYIGVQGSQRARDERHRQLASLGAAPGQIERLYGPVGLISSVRDARILAVSVPAEVLAVARTSRSRRPLA